MHHAKSMIRSNVVTEVLGASIVLSLTPPPAIAIEPVDLEAFRDHARERAGSPCVEQQQLFVVDGTFVVHSFAGRCVDASYGVTLFGRTPDDVLCRAGQTIAGHVERCEVDTVVALFHAIVTHLTREQAESITIPGHSVNVIRWRPWWRFW